MPIFHQRLTHVAEAGLLVGHLDRWCSDASRSSASGHGSRPSDLFELPPSGRIGAQKIVADLDTAFRRIESYALPLEDARAARSTVGRARSTKVLIVNAEPVPGRVTVLIVGQAIGF